MTQDRVIFVSAILVLMLLSNSRGFVIIPHQEYTRTMTNKLTWHAQSSRGVEPEKKSNNILGKLVSTVNSWFHPNKPKVSAIEEEEKVESDVILTPRQRNKLSKMYSNLQPYPWPFSAIEKTITRSVNRELSKEQRRATPLLKDAQLLIQKDKDLLALLGTPIHLRPIFSGSSSTSTINWKKTRRIMDKFVVDGSKESGVATLIADKYARGHIKALRVDVSGIHYDIEI